MTYAEADAKLQGRCKDSRKVGNNTYLQRRGENIIAVRLHKTDILMLHPNGDVHLNSGGWRTVTTKARMNEFLLRGYFVSQTRGQWYLNDVPYRDGMSITGKGDVVNGGCKTEVADQAKLRRKVFRFAGEFVDALRENKISLPNNGDCWFCALRTEDGGTLGEKSDRGKQYEGHHITEHIKQKYFVPSLIHRALEVMGGSIAMKDLTMAHMMLSEGREADSAGTKAETAIRAFSSEWTYTGIKRMLARYMLRQLGMAA